ncbi:MAG: hypothetical protein ABJO06_14560, partial [Roseibium sp.]
MALIDRVKERTGTDLGDAELQAMIDAIEADLTARLGATGEITVDLGDPTDPASAFRQTLHLARALDADETITVVELHPGNTGSDDDELTLAADDFRVLHGGRTLQRLTGGTHP